MKAYLSGAIEYASDGGRAWRDEMTDWLKEQLDHDVFNPARHRPDLSREETASFRKWKVSDYRRFMDVVRKIIDHDLTALVEETDYVICYWNEGAVRGAGTQGELTVAYHVDKPVYLVRGLPRGEISSWILGCSTRDFDSFDLLKEYLRRTYAS